MRKIKSLSLLVCFILFLCGTSSFGEKIQVAVSLMPQKYFVDKIGGDLVDTIVVIPPGADPHTYEPKAKQMIHLSDVKLYLSIGATFEQIWLKRISKINKEMMIIDMGAGIQKMSMDRHHEKLDIHHHEDEILDPHIWLSPPLVRIMAANIRDSLTNISKNNSDTFKKNFLLFALKINEVDLKILDIFKNATSKKYDFLVFHPTWGYFAREYGLNQIVIESEGKEPSPKELLHIVASTKKLGLKTIFTQPQFSGKSAEIIAKELDAKIVLADPMAYNWDDNLYSVAKMLGLSLH